MSLTKTILAQPISNPYLLVTFLPYHVDGDGEVWIDRLWRKDLVEHLVYVKNLTLLAPKHLDLDFRDAVKITRDQAKRIKFVALPKAISLSGALRALPKTILQSWKAVGEASIVHSSVIGWPIPIGWIVNPIALLRGKLLFIVVESALWRISNARDRSLNDKLKAKVHEWLASYFVNRAHLTMFTHESYRSSLSKIPRGKSIVIPASWIDKDNIITIQEVKAANRKTGPTRFFCPSRLTHDKGIETLIHALQLLDRNSTVCEVTIMGVGELRSACDQLASQLSAVRLRVLDPVDYGEKFFKAIREHDCVVIPIISDEQPRVIFDAYSQCRPVVASDTDGIRPHVIDGQTGWLVKPKDPIHLAFTLKAVIRNRHLIEQNRATILNEAAKLTHQEMHRKRWEVLAQLISHREMRSLGKKMEW